MSGRERFGALQPEIDLRVLAADQPVRPGAGGVDVANLFGAGHWDGLVHRCSLASGSIRCAAQPITKKLAAQERSKGVYTFRSPAVSLHSDQSHSAQPVLIVDH